MIRNLVASVALVTLASALGCTTTLPPQKPPTITSGVGPGCALGVNGATASAEDTRDGVSLAVVSMLRTDEIRVRARDAASMYGPDARRGLGHDGRHGQGGKHGLMSVQLPPMRASVVDVERGSRIDFVPVDASDADALRAKVRERATSMSAACE